MPLLLAWALACTVGPELPVPLQAPQAAPEAAPAPSPPQPPPLEAPGSGRFAASHILIPWRGAVDAPDELLRSKEEARALAEALRERALGGADFGALAREHSAGPSAARGGALGTYDAGTMVPPFEAAVAAVEPGAIGPIAESPFGFHVVRRDAVREAEASHILVTWAGAWRSSAQRDRAEARVLVEAARERIAAGEPFADVARAVSEDAAAPAGGALGTVAPGQMIPAFEDALFALEAGGVSGIVETPYGFHIIRRTR